MKTALVHDYLAQAGGGERVVEVLHDLYPDSPLYTSIYDRAATFKSFAEMDVRTSFLQHSPFSSKLLHKFALPLFPRAFEQFDLSEFDLVISSSSSFAKGVITRPETCHVCYCHTPPRFAWRQHEYLSRGRASRMLAPLLQDILTNLRNWDINSAQRVDYFIANSHNIARRIKKYYRRDATVIYPPVPTDRFQVAPRCEVGDYFLVVSRLVGYKRVDLAVEACNHLDIPLHVIGTGPEIKALRKIAGRKTQILGALSDKQVRSELSHCRALIFPGEDDFGMTPVEAMASGRPVIAYHAGGALETVVEGHTGLFFHEQTMSSLASALVASRSMQFHADELRAHARKFDIRVFKSEMQRFVDNALLDHRLSMDTQHTIPAGHDQEEMRLRIPVDERALALPSMALHVDPT